MMCVGQWMCQPTARILRARGKKKEKGEREGTISVATPSLSAPRAALLLFPFGPTFPAVFSPLHLLCTPSLFMFPTPIKFKIHDPISSAQHYHIKRFHDLFIIPYKKHSNPLAIYEKK